MAKGTADTTLVKQGYAKLAYTPDTMEDFTNCAHPYDGALYFMTNHVKIQHPTKGSLSFEPFPYQYELIKNYNDYRYSINMLGRQMGKTTVAAGYLLWYAMFKPDSTILVAAHKQAGAQEIMQRIRYAYESVPNHIRAGVTEYNKGSMTMDNGSRIISATNKDLAEEVRKGNFRQDLYYRLMGLSIHLPKLIERDNDILVLAHHFSADYAKKNNLGRRVLSEEATNKLIAYHYPGNIRELKSIIDLACVLTDNGTIGSEHIIFNDLSNGYVEMSDLDLTLKDRNKRLIENMLDRHNNNVRLVAKKLGIGKSTIYRLLK